VLIDSFNNISVTTLDVTSRVKTILDSSRL